MHSTYFKQTCSHEVKTGTGGDGRPTYAAAVVLPCFKIVKVQLVRDKTGAQVVSSCEVRAATLIDVDDRVDSRTVIARGEGRRLFGELDFYAAYLA